MAGEIGTAFVKVLLDPSGISQGVAEAGAETQDRFQEFGDKAGAALKSGLVVAGAALTGIAVFAKKATDSTIDLAKSTIALTRATGMETETASAWVQLLKVRGIESSSFQTMLVRLSRNMETWRAAGENSNSMLKTLGVNFKDVREGNIQAVLLQAADAFAKMKNPAQRAAAAQALFGRQGQALLPILMKGRKGVEDQLATVEKFGATISDKTVNDVKELSEAQRDLALAQEGVKTSVGSALIPAQAALWGALDTTVQKMLPVTKNADVMTGVLAAGVAVWGAYKAAIVATSIMQSREAIVSAALIAKKIAVTAATHAQTAAQWLLNAAMTANPIMLVVVALAALAVAFVIAWKKSETFRRIVLGAWDAIKNAAGVVVAFIRKNWQYLLAAMGGPFVLAAVAIIKNWDKIKDAAGRAWAAIKGAAKAAIDAIRGYVADLPGRVYQLALTVGRRIAQGIKDGLGDLAGFFRDKASSWLDSALDVLPGRSVPGPMAAAAGPLEAQARGGGEGGGLAGPVPVGQRLRHAMRRLDQDGGFQAPAFDVRVYIGDQELTHIVRTEVAEQDSRTARVILSGAGA